MRLTFFSILPGSYQGCQGMVMCVHVQRAAGEVLSSSSDRHRGATMPRAHSRGLAQAAWPEGVSSGCWLLLPGLCERHQPAGSKQPRSTVSRSGGCKIKTTVSAGLVPSKVLTSLSLPASGGCWRPVFLGSWPHRSELPSTVTWPPPCVSSPLLTGTLAIGYRAHPSPG